MNAAYIPAVVATAAYLAAVAVVGWFELTHPVDRDTDLDDIIAAQRRIAEEARRLP